MIKFYFDTTSWLIGIRFKFRGFPRFVTLQIGPCIIVLYDFRR